MDATTVRRAVVVGPDRGLADALSARGVTVARIEGVANADRLTEAGVGDADLLVLTDAAEATAVPVVRDLVPGIRTVMYSPQGVPEFVRGQLDLAVDPGLLDPDVVAEELLGEGPDDPN